jgi:hypothetical protein
MELSQDSVYRRSATTVSVIINEEGEEEHVQARRMSVNT